jgi:L-alanine-DL-glutamate epimerase-like enolase superfamily enzyme
MALIKTIDTGLYRIPLTVSLSDSTHGKISAFELVTCRVRDSDGAEGVGYTYTVGRNGGAIADALRREVPELIEGREADDMKLSGITSGGPCTTAAAVDRPCSRCRRSISPCGT